MTDYVFRKWRGKGLGYYDPIFDEILVNGKYPEKLLERKIVKVLTHETIHAVLLEIEGFRTSKNLDKSSVVELKGCWGEW